MNPLLEFARKPEVFVKLPSNGNWYNDGDIKYSMNDEVAVYSMRTEDELLQLNPDALLSGESNIRLIESCCPDIKNVKDLLYPDAMVLLLAIQKATYGDTLSINIHCPECGMKALELKDEEKIKEAIQKGEINPEAQEFNVSIDSLLQQISYLEESYVYETEDGLKIYYRPTLLKDKLKYGLINFNQEKILKYYKNYNFEEYSTQDDKKDILKEIHQLYININHYGNEMIADSIVSVELPDGSFVNDYKNILEYVSNTKSTIINDLHNKIKEINDMGINTNMIYQCDCCGHEWEGKLPTYNQADFFGLGS